MVLETGFLNPHCDIAWLLRCALDTSGFADGVAFIIVHVHHYNMLRLRGAFAVMHVLIKK
jgi:hypothetical protein